MDNSTVGILAFISGAAVGAVVAWKLLKTKYEQIAQEEIDSVKEVFAERLEELKGKSEDSEDDSEEDSKPSDDSSNMKEYSNIIKKAGYNNEKGEAKDMNKPFVISPDEFDDSDYEKESLNYYADGVVADDYDNVINDVDSLIGEDSLNHFGEYEEDTVYVQNDELKTVFEICCDARKYSDVYPMEG